jgi:hypothetical protein
MRVHGKPGEAGGGAPWRAAKFLFAGLRGIA